jgi:hypothetical protein
MPYEETHTCSGERTACHSSSDLALLALDIFRMVTKFDGIGGKKCVGRETDRYDERAAHISDDRVMCAMR